MKTFLFVLLLLSVKLANVYLQTCNYTSAVEIKYDESDHADDQSIPSTSSKTANLEGCISNTSFNIEKVAFIGVYCNNVSIPIIESHFINNMEFLKIIYIGPCGITAIEAGAFMNVPLIRRININNNIFTKIPSGLFNILPSLEILHIYFNKVSEIEDDAFGNLPKLREFLLANNKMDYLKKSWFTNTNNIANFTMYKNLIRKIPYGMFNGWKRLQTLDLSANLISEIEGPLLRRDVPFMRVLALHLNKLKTLPTTLFKDYIFIQHFAISGNLLNYISEEVFKNVRLAEISIFGNPFSCPCLTKINLYFLAKRVLVNNPERLTTLTCQNTGADVPVCGLSAKSPKVCVEEVDKNLTNKIISFMKDARYDTVQNSMSQQCAMFDESD